MWDMQYQQFLRYVQTYFPQFAHLLPQNPQQVQQTGKAEKLHWVTAQQAAAYKPSSAEPEALFDQNEPVIYLKSLDSMGRTVTTILDYVQRPQESIPANPEYDALKATVDSMGKKLDALINSLSGASKEVSDNGKSSV